MKIGAAFPGQYLKADEFGDKGVIVTLDHVETEDVGDGHKPVLYFKGKDKGLVLNKTNANMLQELTGTDETDDWQGKRVVLYKTRTDFQGKRVPCLRFMKAPPDKNAPPPPPPPIDDFTVSDDDVPF